MGQERLSGDRAVNLNVNVLLDIPRILSNLNLCAWHLFYIA